MSGALTFARDLFDQGTVEGSRRGSCGCSKRLRLIRGCGSRVSTCSTSAERERVLVGWNDTAVGVPGGALAGLFEVQVGRTPDAVAVVFEGQRFLMAS